MSNAEMYYSIQYRAIKSSYWGRNIQQYYLMEQYDYAPMIEDDLFAAYFKSNEVVGVLEMEQRIGRRLKIEELTVCPLSVNYLLFGRPLITGTPQERDKLCCFADIIDTSIKKSERMREMNKQRKKLRNSNQPRV